MSEDASERRAAPGSSPPWISADEVFSRVGFEAAIHALQRELRNGFEPGNDFSRSILDVDNGQLLVMPSRSRRFVGVKVATVAPKNPDLGKARIQATYLLMDAATLSPIAFLDGTALTALRTPATSAAVADYLAPHTVDHLVVFGSGPQARGHIQALATIRTLHRVTIVARNRDRAAALAEELHAAGMIARTGDPADVRDAQMIVCATTARSPLFDGIAPPDDSCTIAVGSHEPQARELDSALAARAQIVVEDVAVALRESGDVIIPIAEGVIQPNELIAMRDIVTGKTPVDHSRPRIFTSSGMSWEDLVIASEVYENS
jgi:ornithine cyclodeaminase/alanine dehydrogenase-like protein (mu-crystallin family)